jgi:hypothetical protein
MLRSANLNFAMLLISVALTSGTGMAQLRGTVTDPEGAVIRRAHVFVHWDRSGADVGLKSNVGFQRDDLTLETDESGGFRVELPPGFYDVFITANAFSPECRKIRIKPGEAATYKAVLKADPLVGSELGDRAPH